MTTALLIALVLVAGLACPAMMWWNMRRGRDAPCCPPRKRPDRLEELRARRLEVQTLIDSAEDPRVERGSGDPLSRG